MPVELDLPDVRSPWILIPAAIGGVAGLVVLLTRRPASSQSTASIPVYGQESGSGQPSAESILNAVNEQIAAILADIEERNADIDERITDVTRSLSEQIAAIVAERAQPDYTPEYAARAAVGEQAIIDTALEYNVPSWTMLAFLGTFRRLPRGYAEFRQFAAQEGWYDPTTGAWNFPEVRGPEDIPITWQRRFWYWWDRFAS